MKAQAGQVNKNRQAAGVRNSKSDVSTEDKINTKSVALGRNIKVKSREGFIGTDRLPGGGSLATLGNEKSAYIHLNGNGYDSKLRARYRPKRNSMIANTKGFNAQVSPPPSFRDNALLGSPNSSLSKLRQIMDLQNI